MSNQAVHLEWPQFWIALASVGLMFYVFSVEQENRRKDIIQQQADRDDTNKRLVDERRRDDQKSRADQSEKAAQAARETPRLLLETSRRAGDKSFITVVNKSPVYDAVIGQMRFSIADEEMLSVIAKKHARPPKGTAGGCPKYGEDGFFVSGCWLADGTYEFMTEAEVMVTKGGAQKIELRINNEFYLPKRYVGELRLFYNGTDSPLVIPDIGVLATRQKK